MIHIRTCHARLVVVAFVGAVSTPLMLLATPLQNHTVFLVSVAIAAILWALCVTVVVEMFVCENLSQHFQVGHIHTDSEGGDTEP